MKNISKHNPKESTSLAIDSIINSNEKRNWVSPEISHWESENIENILGPGGDGGLQTYL